MVGKTDKLFLKKMKFFGKIGSKSPRKTSISRKSAPQTARNSRKNNIFAFWKPHFSPLWNAFFITFGNIAFFLSARSILPMAPSWRSSTQDSTITMLALISSMPKSKSADKFG